MLIKIIIGHIICADADEERLMELNEYLDDKVGDSFSQDEINEICEEGVQRYNKGIRQGMEIRLKKNYSSSSRTC